MTPREWLRYLPIYELDAITFACGITLEQYDGTERMDRVSDMYDAVLAEIARRELPPPKP